MSEPPPGPAPLGLYVHWPYCAKICPYCDFNVVRARGRTDEEARLAAAILADIEGQAALIGPRRLVSIFFGGGTPSLMPPQAVAAIIDKAKSLWPPADDLEITLEANPTDAEAQRFAAFAEAGVARLSLGVQSLDDAALAFLGRNHGAAEARRAMQVAAKAFPRLSVDLIYARPGQTREAWRADLAAALSYAPEHVSPYQLTIEDGTAFGRQARRGDLVPADEDISADLYEITQEVLSAAGFDAYEVSNHARGAAARSRHNLVYWRGWDYVGAGPGAHGRLTIGGVRHATQTPSAIGAYVEAVAKDGHAVAARESLDAHDVALERLLMGLRTLEGVDLADLAPLEIPASRLEDLEGDGFVRLRSGRLMATALGRPVLDRITRDLAG